MITGSNDENSLVSIADVLRRYDEAHPGQLTVWRTSENWMKLIEWQLRPGERIQGGLRWQMPQFLTAGNNNVGSDNPWSIMHRSVLRTIPIRGGAGVRYRVGEYSIGRVLSKESELRWTKQQAQFRAYEAGRRIHKELDFADEDLSDL